MGEMKALLHASQLGRFNNLYNTLFKGFSSKIKDVVVAYEISIIDQGGFDYIKFYVLEGDSDIGFNVLKEERMRFDNAQDRNSFLLFCAYLMTRDVFPRAHKNSYTKRESQDSSLEDELEMEA